MIGGDDDAGRRAGFGDCFTAHDAWRLIVFLTVGYTVGEGTREGRSREPYWEAARTVNAATKPAKP